MKVFVLMCKPFAHIVGTYLSKKLAQQSRDYLNWVTDTKNYIIKEQIVIMD